MAVRQVHALSSAPKHNISHIMSNVPCHRLFRTGQMIFCSKCGCYSRQRVHGLLRVSRVGCSAHGARALEALKRGICPVTGVAFGRPVPAGEGLFDELYRMPEMPASVTESYEGFSL